MAKVCKDIDDWIVENIAKPVKKWVKTCKDLPWYDPRGWFCWLVDIVVGWILVPVGRWVTRTVCKTIAVIFILILTIGGGIVDILVGIFTFNWRRIVDGLIDIGIGSVLGAIGIVRVLILCDTFDFLRGEIDLEALRAHVRKLLEARFASDPVSFKQVAAHIGLDHGVFGLKLSATVYRTVLDSETPSLMDPTAPNLVVLHERGAINLKELCGFEFPQGFWNRKRYKTLKKETVAGGGGGEIDNPISEDELKTYLNSRGAEGPKFIVLPMRDGVLDTKLDTAEYKGHELGLILKWNQDRKFVEAAGHIVHDGTSAAQVSFLVRPIGRTDRTANPPASEAAAVSELCRPVLVGVFKYANTLRGLASSLNASSCQDRHNASGATFIDNLPDAIWKYVLIHELGHCFGLCHVDGIDHIMVSSKESSLWDWSILYNWCVRGEPYFTHDEAKATWDYIVANFASDCLGARS